MLVRTVVVGQAAARRVQGTRRIPHSRYEQARSFYGVRSSLLRRLTVSACLTFEDPVPDLGLARVELT